MKGVTPRWTYVKTLILFIILGIFSERLKKTWWEIITSEISIKNSIFTPTRLRKVFAQKLIKIVLFFIDQCVFNFNFRSTERRKERCRNAARVRRTKEADIFTEIEQSIPLSRQQLQQLDKISVMRVFTNTLKLRILFKNLSKFSYAYFVTPRNAEIINRLLWLYEYKIL